MCKRHTMPHSAQPQHTNHWAPRTRKRHQQEHRPQWPTERSDLTQHAKGRKGDCPGPRKETTTRRTVTQGGSIELFWGGGSLSRGLYRPPPPGDECPPAHVVHKRMRLPSYAAALPPPPSRPQQSAGHAQHRSGVEVQQRVRAGLRAEGLLLDLRRLHAAGPGRRAVVRAHRRLPVPESRCACGGQEEGGRAWAAVRRACRTGLHLTYYCSRAMSGPRDETLFFIKLRDLLCLCMILTTDNIKEGDPGHCEAVFPKNRTARYPDVQVEACRRHMPQHKNCFPGTAHTRLHTPPGPSKNHLEERLIKRG